MGISSLVLLFIGLRIGPTNSNIPYQQIRVILWNNRSVERSFTVEEETGLKPVAFFFVVVEAEDPTTRDWRRINVLTVLRIHFIQSRIIEAPPKRYLPPIICDLLLKSIFRSF